MQGKNKTSTVITTLFVGWVSGMATWGISTWYLNTNNQTGETTPGDVPHLALRQSSVMSDTNARINARTNAREATGETAMATDEGIAEGIAPAITLPSGPGNTPRRSTMNPTGAHTQTEVPAPLPVYEAESAGLYGNVYADESPLDDGQVQDTGEFIDADDPQAYTAYLNAQSTDETVQNTGEFIDVENPQRYVNNDSLYQSSSFQNSPYQNSPYQNSPYQNTGEYIDADDPQSYENNFNEQSDGIVRDTGEFIEVEPLHY